MMDTLSALFLDRDLNRAMTPTSMRDQYLQDNPQFDPRLEVKDFMSWPIRSVSADLEVPDVARMMLAEKFQPLW